MKKEEIAQKICDVYNALNTLTLTGFDNFKTVSGCMEELKNVLPEILNLNVVTEENKGLTERGG